MAIDNLKSFEKIYPIFIQKYESYIPSEENAGVTEKINSMIQYLSQIGRLNNDVVNNWNKVMQWVLAEGMNEVSQIEINKLIVDGTFSLLIADLNDEKMGEFSDRVDGKLSELQGFQDAVDEMLATGSGVDAQARIDIADHTVQLADKAEQTDLEIERARISNLTANAGNTDGNAELLDIRVGFDGVTYATAGDAVRSLGDFMTTENEIWEVV